MRRRSGPVTGIGAGAGNTVSVRPATYLGGVAEGCRDVSMVLIETS